jgi:hypothetical protein
VFAGGGSASRRVMKALAAARSARGLRRDRAACKNSRAFKNRNVIYRRDFKFM